MYENIKGVNCISANGTEFYEIEGTEVINKYRPGIISDIIVHNGVAIPVGETKSKDGFNVSLLGHDIPSKAFDLREQMPDNAHMGVCGWGHYRLHFETTSWISEELCDLRLNNDKGDKPQVYRPDVNCDPCLVVADGDQFYMEALKWKLFYLGIKDMSIFPEIPDIVLNEEEVRLIEKHQDALGKTYMQPVYEEANKVFGTNFKTN